MLQRIEMRNAACDTSMVVGMESEYNIVERRDFVSVLHIW